MTTALASVLLGVVGMLGWGVYDFLGGVLSKRVGPFPSLFWSQAAGAALVLLLALLALPGGAWATLSLPGLLLCPVASALYCAGYLFFFRGFEKGNVTIVAATMNLWAVFTMAVAFVVMGQRLTATQTIGATTIIVGAMLASIDRAQVRDQGLQLSRGVTETFAGAVFFGVYWNVSEVISEDLGWLAATVLIKVGLVLALALVAWLAPRRVTVPAGGARTAWTLATMGAVELCAVAAVNYGLTIGDAILVSPIASALSVVTIVLAVTVLQERISGLQSVGIALAVVGIVATAF